MKIMLAVSAFALSIAPASGQSVASLQSPTPVATPAASPAPKPTVHRIRAKRAMSPVVARVAAANRAATQEPLRQAFVNAVQVFPFSDGAIYQVYTAPGAVTDISLQPGESLVAVAAGDTVRWIIGDTTSGSGAQKRTHILVKPSAPGLATNLVITTDRRSYHLQLTATSRTAMAALSWTYPADQLIALRRAADQAAAAEPVAEGLSIDNLHFNYTVSGDRAAWRPLRAFDDGRQTFVEFSASIAVGEAPPLFIIGPTGEAELVNYRVRGRFYVVDRIGVLIDTVEGQKLLARREPGDQQSTGDMILLEGETVEIPDRIEGKGASVPTVKAMLNRLAGLTNLDFEPDAEGTFKSRPSFRDLMAFTFQPQNIVANPDVMFFKADTTEHREKLKTIFPYMLQAVTADVLQARYELDRLGRILRRRESDLRALVAAGNAWRLEAQSWLRQAIEFGLLPSDQAIPTEWPDIVDLLRGIVASNSEAAHPTIAGIDAALGRLQLLRDEESRVAADLTQHRQRLSELRRLIESSDAYGSALRIQRDRLSISDWLRQLVPEDRPDDAVAVLADGGREKVEQLSDAMAAIEVRLRTHPSISDTLDKEILRLRAAAESVLVRLNEIRREIGMLERNSAQAKQAIDRFDRMERFLGRLEQALELYDRTDQSAGLRQEIDALKTQIAELQRRVSETEIGRKLRNALDSIEATTGRLIPRLDAEWPDAPVRLMIADLTVKVIRGTRDDYLWEIGSGANWLAYHVALTLALQTFFLDLPHHPVPGLLIYDQPSQVYFPRRSAGDEKADPITWRDEDVVAVRKVFSLLGEQVTTANGRLQVIVLDHADEDVWGDLDGVVLAEQWRDHALVPHEWLNR